MQQSLAPLVHPVSGLLKTRITTAAQQIENSSLQLFHTPTQ